MRYDKEVYFQRIIKGEYDPDKGEATEDTVEEEKRNASVTSAGIKTMMHVYGEIKKGAFVVRLQNRYEKPFDRIRIGATCYKVDTELPLRTKQAFLISEV